MRHAILCLLAVCRLVDAFFSMNANGPGLVVERVDPIINPNALSGHVHSIYGGSNFGQNLTSASLRASKCTSIPIQEDKSAYWFPSLYFAYKNGSVALVDVYLALYYYYDDAGTSEAFPDDFQMVAGNPGRRTFDASSYAQQAIRHKCLGNAAHEGAFSNPLPGYACDQLRGQIAFPTCGNGKPTTQDYLNADHVVYPNITWSGEAVTSYTCPASHPKRYPLVFFEAIFQTKEYSNMWDQAFNPSQPFVYSMGDGTGYGLHADYVYGWDTPTLNNLLKKCVASNGATGSIGSCKQYVTLSTTWNSDSTQCHKTPDVNEPVRGLLPYLPGCMPYGKSDLTNCKRTPDWLTPSTVYTGLNVPQGACQIGDNVGANCKASQSVASNDATTSGTGDGSSSSSSSDQGGTSNSGPNSGSKSSSSDDANSAGVSSSAAGGLLTQKKGFFQKCKPASADSPRARIKRAFMRRH